MLDRPHHLLRCLLLCAGVSAIAQPAGVAPPDLARTAKLEAPNGLESDITRPMTARQRAELREQLRREWAAHVALAAAPKSRATSATSFGWDGSAGKLSAAPVARQ